MKRFYKEVATVPAEAGRWQIELDGRPVRTPQRRLLTLPTEGLAALVAEEWAAQGEEIKPREMPLTTLATTVHDLMPQRREDAIAEIEGYAATDLLCYRADGPPDLVQRQHASWQPWLDWAEQQFDARLAVATAVQPLEQPDAALRALAAAVRASDDWRLVGLHAVTTLTGSIVLGLALARGAVDAERALDVALLDELFEIERWGLDEEQRIRHERLLRDLVAAERFLRLLPV
ncbi:MAG: ATP12 family protein [Geminicoccaceae bacterium]